VFGDPQHEGSKTLLAPLQTGLPKEWAGRLSDQPQRPDAALLLDVHFTGVSAEGPDLAALFAALGGKVELLQGGVERIQDRAIGHLILSVAGSPHSRDELLARARTLAPRAEVLGYVG
ncbi:ABC transporter, partial [Pseudomonas syringae]|uniref:NIL domain-containing protein n=1 Tax=Pseudomonas syringae TaxID=317 RepID=UPI001F8851F1